MQSGSWKVLSHEALISCRGPEGRGDWLENLVGDHFVSLVQQYSFWGNLLGVEGEGHDGDDLAGADEVGGGSVDDDVTGFGFAGDNVGFESSTAGDAGDENFFADPEVNGLHEVGGNGDAAFVIDVGIGDSGAVDFGFELMAKHGPERWTQWLMGQGEAAQWASVCAGSGWSSMRWVPGA